MQKNNSQQTRGSKILLSGAVLCAILGAIFLAYSQIALEAKKRINPVDLFLEGSLVVLVFMWALIILPHWKELRILSLGILLFLIGNFSDLLDEFLRLPPWVRHYFEGGSLLLGAALAAIGFWLWLQERQRFVENLKAHSENQRFLRELSQDITQLDIATLLQKLTEKVRELFNVDLCEVEILEGESWRAMARSGTDRHLSPSNRSGILSARIRWIVENSKPLVISDSSGERGISHEETAKNHGAGSYLGVPLLSRTGEVIGVLSARTEQPREFKREEIDLLQQLANGAAIALENARLLEEIRMKSRQLVETYETKSEFLNTVAHELKTPLGVMYATEQLFMEEFYGELTENHRKGFEIIERNIQHALHLIDNILDFVRLESDRVSLYVEEFDLEEVIEELEFSFASLVKEKGLDLKFDIPDNMLTLKSDRAKVKAVLENLLSNAVKYTDHGEVELRINTISDGSSAGPQGDRLSITVRDTGIGIKQGDLPHIFDGFYMAEGVSRKKYPGSGLGLSIVKRILELLKGDIQVQSEWGKGSTFTATLPLVHRSD